MKKTVPNQQFNLDIKQTTPMICSNPECGSDTYIPVMKLRKVPKLLTGSKEDQILPVSVYMCVSCGLIPEQFKLDSES